MARPKLFTRDELSDLLLEAETTGKSVATLAREVGISTGHMYRLFHEHDLHLRQVTEEERIEVLEDQRETGEPAELVAHNNGVKLDTLRRWSYRYEIPLRCTKLSQRRPWWRRQLLGIDLHDALITMQMDGLPLYLAVPAYHYSLNPPTPLLWGDAGATRTLHEPQYPDRGVQRVSLPDGERLVPLTTPDEDSKFFYGQGTKCWAITEAQYRHLKQTHQLREIG